MHADYLVVPATAAAMGVTESFGHGSCAATSATGAASTHLREMKNEDKIIILFSGTFPPGTVGMMEQIVLCCCWHIQHGQSKNLSKLQ